MEMISSGLSLEWMYNEQIAVFTFSEFTQQAVNVWTEHVPNLSRRIPSGQTWYILHDFGKAAIDFSFRDSVISTFQRVPPNQSVFAALVTVNPIFIQLLRNTMMVMSSRSIVRDVFANRQTALKWLMMKVDRI